MHYRIAICDDEPAALAALSLLLDAPPQAARLRVSTPARKREVSFFGFIIQFTPFGCFLFGLRLSVYRPCVKTKTVLPKKLRKTV